MPAITKDAIKRSPEIQLLLTALTRCRFADSISERSKIANDAVEALAATEHITDTAATQAAGLEPQDGLVLPRFAAPASQHGSEFGGWISVDDRMPDEGQDVIILYWPYDNHENAQTVGQAHHVEGAFYTDEGDDCHPPSHWMPLPPPPGEQPSIAGSARAGRNAKPDSATDLAPTDLSAVEVPPLPEPVDARCQRIGYNGKVIMLGDEYSSWENHRPSFAAEAQGARGFIPRDDMVNWQCLFTADQMTNFYRDAYAAGRASMKGNK